MNHLIGPPGDITEEEEEEEAEGHHGSHGTLQPAAYVLWSNLHFFSNTNHGAVKNPDIKGQNTGIKNLSQPFKTGRAA